MTSSSARNSVCPYSSCFLVATSNIHSEKEKKRVNKAAQQQQVKPAEAQPEAVSPEVLKQAVDAVKSEPPVALADRESFFMNQISMGETLAAQGMHHSFAIDSTY